MTIEQSLSRWFRMSDAVWARHANPWSVWTRYPCLPLLALAVWSRVWIGGWAWLPVMLILVWIWLNPRVFSVPSSTDSWASKAVLGERVWLNRKQVPIASHHGPIVAAANGFSALGAIACVYGLIVLNPYHVVYGTVLTVLGKSWFLDRMVWLLDETHSQDAK